MMFLISMALVVIAFMAGLMIGYLIKDEKRAIGTLKINTKDPSEDLFHLRFDRDIGDFMDEKYATFRIMKV